MRGLAAAHAHGYLPANCTLNCCTFALPINPGASRTPVVGQWALAGVRHLRWGCKASCPFRTAAKKRQVGMMKVSDEAWREMRIFVLPSSRRAAFWQDIAEMYPRTAHYGEIKLLCPFELDKRCPKVHFSDILPETLDFPAQVYKMSRFCRLRARRAVRRSSVQRSSRA